MNVSSSNDSRIKIGKRLIGPDEPCFVIAEIGNNHNGDFDRAISLIDAAKSAGADCAKFQMRVLDQVYREGSLQSAGDDLSVEYTIDLLRRFELSTDSHLRLKAYAESLGLIYLCTPWDVKSLSVLTGFGVAGFKVASADLTNLPLLSAMVASEKPLIVSTGMSTLAEIRAVTHFLQSRAAKFALLHCQSTYPAAFHNINLRFMSKLRELHPLVGYSGHERGTAVTTSAVALGACVVERHLTFDRTMEGPDHAASLEPREFTVLVSGIREVEASLGPLDVGAERPLSQGELINRENLAKSLVATRDLPAGTVISDADVMVRSPGQGLSPILFPSLIGRVLGRSMQREDYFYPSDLNDNRAPARRYRFRRPWGVPVRYHDVKTFIDQCHPDIVEFHLSYQDMDRDPSSYLTGPYHIGFVVHAPELFVGSRLMDLASDDETVRRFSITQTQRVVDITRSLKKFFPNTPRPLIVANVGGFSTDAPVPTENKERLYATFARSLNQLDLDGVELIPQTMAPFPWHFGGQRYQNIFIFPDESAAICSKLGLRMCVDISHTKLAANYFHFDFVEGIAALGPFTAHYHLGDAKGLDGEGLQIGDGDISFELLASTMQTFAPSASFIPEIWQGHKNLGEGFWVALERLEQWF